MICKITGNKIKPFMSFGKMPIANGFLNKENFNNEFLFNMEVGFSKGKKAITNYKTLEVFENSKTPTFSFVEFELETGRTHQIRVHMSYKGNNILGDKKYKKKFKKLKNINKDIEKTILNLDRQFLHAKILGFDHPKTDKYMEFQSNLPKELENILKKLRNTNK